MILLMTRVTDLKNKTTNSHQANFFPGSTRDINIFQINLTSLNKKKYLPLWESNTLHLRQQIEKS
jgi:hypothetical protein